MTKLINMLVCAVILTLVVSTYALLGWRLVSATKSGDLFDGVLLLALVLILTCTVTAVSSLFGVRKEKS